MKNTRPALSREIYPGIFKISLPFPGRQPGPINVYLFLGERNTLLDAGITGTVRHLRKALLEIGLDFSDIDDIVITHGHIDHYGGAFKIVKQSRGRARVCAHAADAKPIETGEDVPRDIRRRFLRVMGVPLLYILTMQTLRNLFKSMGDDCGIDVILKEGDEINLGRYRANVIGTPGHSRGSICFYLKEQNLLFAGDHLLEHITPNPLVMLDPDSVLPGRSSQSEYYQSLSKIEALGSPMIYTGHGRDIDDIKKVAALYRRQYEERRTLILSVLETGDFNIYQIARKIFPNLSGVDFFLQIFLSISEVFTHVQVLEREKMVRAGITGNRFIVKKI